MTDPARGKNPKPVMMINPHTGRNLLFQQLQWNQAAIQARGYPPFDQVTGRVCLKTLIERVDPRLQ